MNAPRGDDMFTWLEQAGLQQHYPSLRQKGVTLSNLASLTMQDYNSVGVSTMPDRRKLFQLIQLLKREGTGAVKENVPPPVGADAAAVGWEALQPLCDDGDATFDLTGDVAPLRTAEPNSQGLAQSGVVRRYAPPRTVPAPQQEPEVDEVADVPEPADAPPVAAPRPRTAAGGGRKGRSDPRIRVCVRLRPPTEAERERGDCDIIRMEGGNTLIMDEPKTRVDLTKFVEEHAFVFDEVFANADNEHVYQHCAKPLIDTVFEGGRATCFAYGQTGSGKTYTMLGKGTAAGKGLYAIAARDLFRGLQPGQYLACNYYEIYGGKMFDLLQERQPLVCREDAKGQVNICGLKEVPVNSVEELLQIVEEGNGGRAQGATSANVDSSRSHAVLTINVKCPSRRKARRAEVLEDDTFGRFSFIDLAGSERGSDAAACDKATRVEGAEINKSLLALKECIRALDQSARHVPFRGSKLTEVLRESFTGNSRTAMIACVAPGSWASEDSLNTLRYADRVKSLTRDKGDARRGAEAAGFDPVTMMSTVGTRGRKTTRKAPALQPPAQQLPPQPLPSAADTRPQSAAVAAVAQLQRESRRTAPRPAPAARPPWNPSCSPPTAMDVEQEETAGTPLDESADSMVESMDTDVEPHTGMAQPELEARHEVLIETILQEEEQVIASHRVHVDEVMEIIRDEMQELNIVDQPGSSIDAYITKLDSLLKKKQQKINAFRKQLGQFKRHLREEEALSQHFAAHPDGVGP